MTIETVPLTLPPSADPSKFTQFGREVIGVDPGNLSPAEFAEIEQLLYAVNDQKSLLAQQSPDHIPARRSSFPKCQLFSRTTVCIDKGRLQIRHLTTQALTPKGI